MRLRVCLFILLYLLFLSMPTFAVEDVIELQRDSFESIQELELDKDINDPNKLQSDEPIKAHVNVYNKFEDYVKNGLSINLDGKILKELKFGAAFQGELDYDTYQGESGGYVKYYIPVTDIYVMGKFADKHESEAKFMINPARTLSYGSYFPGILQDVYFATKPTKNTKLLIGNSRTPIGHEGGLSAYSTPLIMRAQFSRNYGDIRALGVKLTGDYKWVDYNVGIYDSSRYFYDMFKGAEFTGWVNFKPLANLDEDKYGKMIIGTGYNCGRRNTSYSVWGTYFEYQYKKLTLNAEYAYANGHNGRQNTGTQSDGFYTTIMYKLHPRVELVGRYDLYNPDKNIPKNNRTEIAAGINYYIIENKFMFALNYFFKMYDKEKNSNGLYFLTQFMI